MSSPLVSIITVNYNQAEVTFDMLESLTLYKGPLEIIVVDNGSVYNPEEEIKQRFPDIQFIRSEQNLGFAGGNNLGIDVATGEYLFFINNDTEITSGLIEGLIEFMQSTPDAGAISPKIHYFDQPGVYQFAGFKKINILTGRNSTIGEYEEDNGQYNTVREIPYVHGAAMMVRKSVLECAGKMPEEFFLYYEELDWSERIRDCGYKLYFVPSGIIRHKESVSTGKNSPFKTYYLNRNRILFMRRNNNFIAKTVFLMFFTVVSMPVNMFRHWLKGEKEHIKELKKAYFWNFSREGKLNGKISK